MIARLHELFRQTDAVIIHLGGKAGRLGECVVATGLLEATLQALRAKGKAGTPVSIIVDAGAIELFDEQLYQQRYWPHIRVLSSAQHTPETLTRQAPGYHVLTLDFHGGH